MNVHLVHLLILLLKLRWAIAEVVIAVDHVLTIHLEDVLDTSEGSEARGQGLLTVALLLLLELCKLVHFKVVVALQELSDEIVEVLKPNTRN